MQVTDKKELRRKLIQERCTFPNDLRLELSENIAERLIRSDEYTKCDTVLVFISTRIEVDTSPILTTALTDGKIVGAPRCESKENLMDFYRINSRGDLESGAFDILEPKQGCPMIESFSKAICIVPGLAYDINGHRIGFGRGYYDRFLSKFDGISCGVCFDEFIVGDIPVEPTDIPVNMLVTQSKTIRTYVKE